MSAIGRPMQKSYIIDGEPGWSTWEVAERVCVPGSGLTYSLVSKRLQAGINTWAGLSAPPKYAKLRDRPADPNPPKAAPKPVSLEEVAREHVRRFERERHLLWLSWGGPVAYGQLGPRL